MDDAVQLGAIEPPGADLSPASLAELDERIDLLHQAARNLPPGSDEETQDELGLLLQLVPAVERSRDLALLGNIEIAVESLLQKPPNRLLAIRLREACQQRILRRSFLRSILPGSSASTWVIAGMAALLYITIPIVLAVTYFVLAGRNFSVNDEHILPYGFLVVVGIAGAVGSIISILVRIKDFTEIRILNPPALFWTGFFKPIIGATFALFVFVAFASGLIQVTDGVDQKFMYLTLAFVAGFSERFAPDLVSRIERSVDGSRPTPPPSRAARSD